MGRVTFIPDNTDGFVTPKEAVEMFGVNRQDVLREAINHAWEIRYGKSRVKHYDIDDILDLKEGKYDPVVSACLGCGQQAMEGRYYCSRCDSTRKTGDGILRPEAMGGMV